MNADIIKAIDDHLAVIAGLRNLTPLIQQVADRIKECFLSGGKLLLMGNGGSAADCQHIAAELVWRFSVKERRGLPAIALTTDTSILTSIINDIGFETIFERQIDALCNANDVVIGISTSGNSVNVNNALIRARQLGAFIVGFSGESGGKLVDKCDLLLNVPSTDTARIQEAHILMGHILCQLLDGIQR